MKTILLRQMVQAAGLIGSVAFAAPRSATFDVRHELKVTVPENAKRVRIWFAMPQDDPLQQVNNFKLESPISHRITIDSEGNKAVYLELDEPRPKDFNVIETFTLSRREQISGVDARNARPLSANKRAELAPFLAANQHVTIDDRIRNLATEIVGSEKNPVLAARKLYDWELANIDYWVKDPIGNIDERRVTWSRGRDLTLSPKQDAGPVNALAKAYVEVDGKPAAEKEIWTRKLTFREIRQ